jgi:hypothetical protein|tara:strand:- start:5744 stop:6283 length:540 start_codon:yes stop_codon:yes gene_type:complete
MDIKSLTLKNRLIIDETGEGYWDFTAPSFVYDSDLGVRALHYVMVDQVGRIDKISEKYYGSGEFIDALCVVNNIFNPFSIEEGDILVIPNLSRKDLVYKRPNPATRPNDVQEAYVDTGRQSEKDQSRVQRLIEKAKSSENGVKQPMPPNMLQPGQESKTFSGGKIQLGTNLPSRSTKSK